MAFAPEAAPREREAFLRWYASQTQWADGRTYDDPSVCTPQLRAWFTEMAAEFPPMNGPHSTDDPDNLRVTDYSVGRSFIYAAFAPSQAEPAASFATRMADKYRVGLFDPSGDGTIRFPADAGQLVLPHSHWMARLPARVRGLIVLAVGLGLSWWQIWIPLHAAELGLQRVWTSTILMGLGVFCVALGGLHIAFGPLAERLLARLQVADYNKLSVRDVVLIIAMAIPVGILFFWVQAQLSAAGYR